MKKKYGLKDNLGYVLAGMTKWGKGLMPVQIIGNIVDTAELFVVPILVKLVIGKIETGSNVESIMYMIGIYAAVILLVYLLQGYVMNQTGWRMKYVLIRFKRELMDTMLTMDYANMENPKVLDEHERIRNVMNNKDASIEGMMTSSVRCGKFILQLLISVLLISKLNILLVFILTLLLITASIPLEKAKKKDKELVWDALGPFWRRHFNMGYLTTHFNTAKEIRLYDMKEWIYAKYLRLNADIQKKYIISEKIWIKGHVLIAVFQLLQEIALYFFLLWSLAKGNLSIADFTLYVSSVHIFSNAVNSFFQELSNLKKQSSEVADFRKFVDTYKKDVKRSEENGPDKPDIEFDDVTFCYESQSKNALENVSIKIPYGQRLAVVGLNGAGKTTFIKLLCGLYSPSEGTIRIAGKEAESLNLKTRFGLFSPVFQNVEEYPFSVSENVSMDLMDKTDEVKVKDCLEKCGLSEKIKKLIFKERTQVLKVLDENGTDFSGGEKQKLAFARALYKDATIIILDEPTAALDPLAEEKMYKDFDRLIGSKTGIYISHRLSSTRFCDVIAMFKDGHIAEYGTHDELMKLKGEYYEIYDAQAQYYKESEEAENEAS